ncbi:ABC transporter substrate-binding protein [Pseudomonas machongensis]
MIKQLVALTTVLALTGASLLAPENANAEGRIRIIEQFGVAYLLLSVIRDQQLIEKHGKADGLEIEVDWTRLSGGGSVNEALLSGSVDVASAGLGPLLTVWDRTHGRQNVKAVASLGTFPSLLVSNSSRIRSIADFTDQDRIAVPAITVSIGARYLQYAAAKQWGDSEYGRLDKYTIALPHPDATTALISGGTELTAHFSMPPFQEQALAAPNIHTVLDSYDLLGPNSPILLFCTERFRNDNPRTYRAFVGALAEAAELAEHDRALAADIYIRATGAKVDREELLHVLSSPRFEFTVVPRNTYKLAEFMHRIGAIRNNPASWRDYFFDDPRIHGGS